jgi:antitoxin component YwqK of YwqJK toxin-antitoxin module
MKNVLFSILAILFISFFAGCNEKIIVENRFPSGSIKEKYTLHNQMFHGEYKAYYDNGQLRAEGEYSRNAMIGEWRHYYRSGKLLSIQMFSNGKLVRLDAWDESSLQVVKDGTGTFVLFYPTGEKMSEVSYFNCQQDGTWLSWFENGLISSEIHYEKGNPTGIWRFWDEKGNLTQTIDKD